MIERTIPARYLFTALMFFSLIIKPLNTSSQMGFWNLEICTSSSKPHFPIFTKNSHDGFDCSQTIEYTPEFSIYSTYSLNTAIGHIEIAGSDYIDSWDVIFNKEVAIKQMPFAELPSQAAYDSLQRTSISPLQHTLVIFPSLSDQLHDYPIVNPEADELYFVMRVADNDQIDPPVKAIPDIIDVFYISSCNSVYWHILIHLSHITSKSYLLIPVEANIEIQLEQSYIYSNGVTHYFKPTPGATAQMSGISHNHSSLPLDAGLIAYYQPTYDTSDALEKFVTQFWLFQRSELTQHQDHIKEPPQLPSTLTALSELMIANITEPLTDPSDITCSNTAQDDKTSHIKQNAEQPPKKNRTKKTPEQTSTEKCMTVSLECAENSSSTERTNTDLLLLPTSHSPPAIEWDEALYNKLDSEEKGIWAANNVPKTPHINKKNRQEIISKARFLLHTYSDLERTTPISFTEQHLSSKNTQRRYIPPEHLNEISKLFQPGVINASIPMHERQQIYKNSRLFLAVLLNAAYNDDHNADNFHELLWIEFSQLFVSAIKHIRYIMSDKANASALLIFLNMAIVYNDINAYIRILTYLPDSFNNASKKNLIAKHKPAIRSTFNNGWQLFQAHEQHLTTAAYSKPVNLDAVDMLIKGAKALGFGDVSPWQQQLLKWKQQRLIKLKDSATSREKALAFQQAEADNNQAELLELLSKEHQQLEKLRNQRDKKKKHIQPRQQLAQSPTSHQQAPDLLNELPQQQTLIKDWHYFYQMGTEAFSQQAIDQAKYYFEQSLAQSPTLMEQAQTYSALADCAFHPVLTVKNALIKKAKAISKHHDCAKKAENDKTHVPIGKNQLNKLAQGLFDNTGIIITAIDPVVAHQCNAMKDLEHIIFEEGGHQCYREDAEILLAIIQQENEMAKNLRALTKEGLDNLISVYHLRKNMIFLLQTAESKPASRETAYRQQLERRKRQFEEGIQQKKRKYRRVKHSDEASEDMPDLNFDQQFKALDKAINELDKVAEDTKKIKQKFSEGNSV